MERPTPSNFEPAPDDLFPGPVKAASKPNGNTSKAKPAKTLAANAEAVKAFNERFWPQYPKRVGKGSAVTAATTASPYAARARRR